ncbi:MAG: ACP S-malonyltransferase [Verrucomicrobiota bacterium]|nr:ACP S-malonyltransferase [Verrucomicrobiota bacterium]
MSKIALLFPGQGAQTPGMGKDFFDSFAIARETFEEADDLLEERLSRIIFTGSAEELSATRYSQLGLFITSTAIFRVLGTQFLDLKPQVVAGLSLGEYSALCASGRLGFKETLKLVQQRALAMSEACRQRKGTMAAVLGLTAQEVEAALQGSAREVWLANYNSPGQLVISGTLEGVEWGSQELKARGAKRIIPLAVEGAFHSPLMQSAQDKLEPLILQTKIAPSDVEQVFNSVGKTLKEEAEIKRALIEQVTHSVRWEESMRSLQGIDQFFEVGAGKTLAGLHRRLGLEAPLCSIEKIDDLEQVACTC